jgi:cleavage and polyadenylation specificity factor subunit 3
MFLEAQFGTDISPIETPRIPLKQPAEKSANGIKLEPEDDSADEDDLEDRQALELQRLHAIGIPVPGIQIKVDKHVANVWLETLEVECSYTVLRDRVKAVMERAVETVAPLWGQQS